MFLSWGRDQSLNSMDNYNSLSVLVSLLMELQLGTGDFTFRFPLGSKGLPFHRHDNTSHQELIYHVWTGER
jgi:hypothetical protein